MILPPEANSGRMEFSERTGVSFFDIPIAGKRLALLRELVPNAQIIAVLHDPNFSQHQTETQTIETAARAIGQKIVTVKVAR